MPLTKISDLKGLIPKPQVAAKSNHIKFWFGDSV